MSSSQDSYNNPRNGDSDTISVNTTWTALTSFHKDITRDDHTTDLGTRHARKSHGTASTTRALPVISLPTHLHSSEKREKEKGKAVDRSHHSHSHTSSRRHHSTHDDSHTEANSSMHSHTENHPSSSTTTAPHTHTHPNTAPSDIDLLRSQIDALKKELHESKKSTRKYFKKAEEARRELKDESASKDLLKRDFDAAKRQIDDAKRERDDAKKDMDNAKCEVEEMKAELKFIEDMKLEMERQKKEVDQAQAEMDEVKKMVEDMKDKVEGAEKEKGEKARLSELMSTIEQSLQCQICLDMLYEPYTISPCGHTLCLPCLQSWFRKAPSASDPDLSDSSTSVSSFHSQSSAQSQESLPLSISDGSENEEERVARTTTNDNRPSSPGNPQAGVSSTITAAAPTTGTDTRTWPILPSVIPGPTTPLEPRPQARVSFSHLFSLAAQRQYLTPSNANDRQARRAAALERRREREERRRAAEERREERRRDRVERRTAREERRTIRRRKTCPCCRTQITQRPVLARVVREVGDKLRAGAPANPLMNLAAASNPVSTDTAKEDPWKGIFLPEPSQSNPSIRIGRPLYLSDYDSDDDSDEEEIGMGGAMGLFFDVEDDEEEEDERYPFEDSDSDEDNHDHDRDNEEGPSTNVNNNTTRNRRNPAQEDDDDDESDLYTEDEDDDDEEHRFFRYMSGEDGEPDDETNNHNATNNHDEEDGIVPFGQADSDSASNASSEDVHPAPSSIAESSAAVIGTGQRRGGPAGPRARGRPRGAGSGLLNLSFVSDLSRMMPRGIGRGRGAGRGGQGQGRGRRRRGTRAGSTSGSRSQSRSAGPPPLLTTTQPQGVQTEENQYQEHQILRLQIPGSLPVDTSHSRTVFPPLPASPPRGGTRVDGDGIEERLGHTHSDQGEEQGPEAGPSNNRPLLSLNLTSPSPRSPSWFYTRWTRSVSLPSPWNAATSRLGVFGLGGRSGDVSEASVDGRDEHEHEHDRDRDRDVDAEEDEDARSELGSLGHARELDISGDEGSASGGSVVYRRIPRRTRNMSRVIESESEGEDVLTGSGPFGRRIVNGNGLNGRRRRVSEPITTSRATYTTASGSGLGVTQIQVQDRPRFGAGAERRRRERMLERRREEWTGSELDNTDDDDDDQGRGYLSFEDSENEDDGRSDVAMVGERRFASMMRRRLS